MKKNTEYRLPETDNFYKFFRITLVLFIIGLPKIIHENYDIVSWYVRNTIQKITLSYDNRIWQLNPAEVEKIEVSPEIPGLAEALNSGGEAVEDFVRAFNLGTLDVVEDGRLERLEFPHLVFTIHTRKKEKYSVHLFVPVPLTRFAYVSKGEGDRLEIYEAKLNGLADVVSSLIRKSELDESTKAILLEKGLRPEKE